MSNVYSHWSLLVGGLVASLSLNLPARAQLGPTSAQNPGANPPMQAGATGNFGFAGRSLPTLRLSDLMNKDLLLQGGQGVGTVSDIVLNRNGSILYLVGANATNEQMFTIPVQAANFSIHDFALTLSLTPEQFRGLPTFNSTTIPNFNSVAYQRSVYTAYGLAKMNQSLEPTDPEREAGTGRTTRSTGIQAGRVGDTVLDPDDDPNDRGSITGTNRSTEARKPPLDPALKDLPEKELGIGNAVSNPLRTPEGKPLPKTLTPNAKSGTNGLPGGPKPNPVGPPKGTKPNPPSAAGGATGGTGAAPGPIKGTTKPLRNP
ncbi:MAG: hypothetical protein SH850_25980 [Planctomycetaceae bacterium]|nr:hypothetical protein [Planctomycetaceae bacterium]